ncbi:uncharacterized protein LOC115405360 [Salarias fasciatus]|uniref:uncharacterized protein LOC115405360 n=1 Tax=Salarias fasciatus TaxID=181472 RepID=UPI001176FE50|nr:uncharacterized protein LOC115405360 [Salarias fasciatus]
MEHWLWILLAALFFECKGEDKVMQPSGDVPAAEGDSVTLNCTFETTASFPYLFWYKQQRNGSPELILQHVTGSGQNSPDFPTDRFDAELKDKSVPLKIQKLELSDSAVYYCALLLITADMRPLFISVLLAAMSLGCRAQKDNVLQARGEVTADEGHSVTLDCLYNTTSSNYYLFWYKQEGNKSPKFILSRFKVGEGKTEDEEKYSSTLDSSLRSVPLKIQKLELSDSAVYYCALQLEDLVH